MLIKINRMAVALGLLGLCGFSPLAFSATPDSATTPNSTGPSSATTNNAHVTPGTLPTGDDQAKGSSNDTNITREIRVELTKDDTLSVAAKNIKIVTLHNKVVLRGEVPNRDEKTKIEKIARSVVGVSAVNDKLKVKPQ